jgi:YidC/Oxa1 family membrane protein insertase
MTSRQMILKTGWSQDPQQRMIQKLMLYGIPFSLLLSGWYFPIGVVIYWVTTNLFSMGQQFWVLKHMPPPNLAGKDGKDKEISAETAKALAPKPGVKPVNPKKGPRPARPAADAPQTGAADAKSGAADAKSDAAPAPGLNGRADTGSGTPAAGSSASNPAGGRRPQDARNRKRKGGRR